MIDEGLWLVCYETDVVKPASCFIRISKGMNEGNLQHALRIRNLDAKTIVITNMVRLGDLKSNE